MFSKYLSKPFYWWLQTPLYAMRHVKNWLDIKEQVQRNGRSANNEDQIIAALLNQKTGYCAEVGALDGINGSNSLFFERCGWKCLLVEAEPEQAAACARNRPYSITINAAAVAPHEEGRVTFQVIMHNKAMSSLSFDEEGEKHFGKHGVEFAPTPIQIEAKTLDSMLEAANFPIIDFITIDVEGHELGVLQGFDFERWKPLIIMLERIQTAPKPEISALMEAHGYQKILTVPLGAIEDCNDLYFKAR